VPGRIRRFHEMPQPQLMPHVAMDDNRLTVQNLRPHIDIVAEWKLDRNEFPPDAGLTTESNGVIRMGVLNDHFLEHSQHTIGRAENGESIMAPATGHFHLTDRGDWTAWQAARLATPLEMARTVPNGPCQVRGEIPRILVDSGSKVLSGASLDMRVGAGALSCRSQTCWAGTTARTSPAAVSQAASVPAATSMTP